MSAQAPTAHTPAAFTSAATLLNERTRRRLVASGVKALDELTGGYEPGLMYLFYSDEKKHLADRVLHGVLADAAAGDGSAVHLICGNYRKSRTLLDTALLLSLLDSREANSDDALDRIHVIGSFSERHQIRAAELTEDLVERIGGASTITVQQATKMFAGKPLVPGVEPGSLNGMLSRLKRLAMEQGIPLVVSCRSINENAAIPALEGGSYLTHLANVIVYLREAPGGGTSAYLVKHFDKARVGRRIEWTGGDILGRMTSNSMRTLLQEQMGKLRDNYRAALKDPGRRAAFDRFWEAWSSEQGAVINSDLSSATDGLLLIAVTEVMREVEKLKEARNRDEG
jgi:hypothetical protein